MNLNDTPSAVPVPNIGALHTRIAPVGSRVTCDPAPLTTDCDWLVLIDREKWSEFQTHLDRLGWKQGGSEIPEESNTLDDNAKFTSFTFGEDNLICTLSPAFFRRFLAATSVSKRLNLMVKKDRIALFQAVLYGSDYTEQLRQRADAKLNLEKLLSTAGIALPDMFAS